MGGPQKTRIKKVRMRKCLGQRTFMKATSNTDTHVDAWMNVSSACVPACPSACLSFRMYYARTLINKHARAKASTDICLKMYVSSCMFADACFQKVRICARIGVNTRINART